MNSRRARSSFVEPRSHALERRRQLAQLVVAVIDDRLVEAAAGDPVGRALEPPDPAGRCIEAAREADNQDDERAQASPPGSADV